MIPRAAWGALIGLAVMLAVVAAYVLLARRFRALWHPLSVLASVLIVSVVVSVLGELLFRGWAGVPSIAQRSAIGGFGWGVMIAIAVWVSRRALFWWTRRANG